MATLQKGILLNSEMGIILKDCGVEWIGKIPSDWEIRPLKYIFNVRNQKNSPVISEEILSLSIDKGVTLYAEKTTNKDRFKEDLTQYKLAYPNDIVMNSMNVIVGAVGLSKYFGCVSPVYYVLFSSNQEKFLVEYYDYLFKTTTIRKVLFSLGKGIMSIEKGNDRVNTCRLKICISDLGRMDFPVPPYLKQKQIVDFLGEKCAEIDNLILLQEQMIDELKAYKKSVVTECICKGLDRSASMKDSGIEWIGNIPNNWIIAPIKYYVSCNDDSVSEDEDLDKIINYIEIGCVNNCGEIHDTQKLKFFDAPSRARRIVRTNDVIISCVRTYLKSIARITQDQDQYICSTGFAVFRPKENINPQYLYYYLFNDTFTSSVHASSTGISYPAINTQKLLSLKILVPPLTEQNTITQYLDKKCMEIDGLISIKQQKIEELTEYKKSFIYEYITGKK